MSLRRHGAHIDKAQPAIVEGLRAYGCTVEVISKKDFPDLLVGYQGMNLLMEVKTEHEERVEKDGYRRKGKKGKLSEGQQKWHDAWCGQVATVHNLAEAVAVVERVSGVGLYRDPAPPPRRAPKSKKIQLDTSGPVPVPARRGATCFSGRCGGCIRCLPPGALP